MFRIQLLTGDSTHASSVVECSLLAEDESFTRCGRSAYWLLESSKGRSDDYVEGQNVTINRQILALLTGYPARSFVS